MKQIFIAIKICPDYKLLQVNPLNYCWRFWLFVKNAVQTIFTLSKTIFLLIENTTISRKPPQRKQWEKSKTNRWNTIKKNLLSIFFSPNILSHSLIHIVNQCFFKEI